MITRDGLIRRCRSSLFKIDFGMLRQHFVRVGILGHVGRFTPVEPIPFARGTRVICRTRRGLEVGEVLSLADENEDRAHADGELLRGITLEDDLLLARLEKHKNEAFTACSKRLAEHGSSAVLMDVEHLFDGQSLYFYYLGEVTPELELLTGDLAETYEAKVQFRKFTDTLLEGCGPGCGTEEAQGNGCGTGSCISCAVSNVCGTRQHKHIAE